MLQCVANRCSQHVDRSVRLDDEHNANTIQNVFSPYTRQQRVDDTGAPVCAWSMDIDDGTLLLYLGGTDHRTHPSSLLRPQRVENRIYTRITWKCVSMRFVWKLLQVGRTHSNTFTFSGAFSLAHGCVRSTLFSRPLSRSFTFSLCHFLSLRHYTCISLSLALSRILAHAFSSGPWCPTKQIIT